MKRLIVTALIGVLAASCNKEAVEKAGADASSEEDLTILTDGNGQLPENNTPEFSSTAPENGSAPEQSSEGLGTATDTETDTSDGTDTGVDTGPTATDSGPATDDTVPLETDETDPASPPETDATDTGTESDIRSDMETEDESHDTSYLEEDSDSDGYAPIDGDCNDKESLINPDALDVEDEVDNDCDGLTDETEPCEEGSLENSAEDLAAAMNLCDERFLIGVALYSSAGAGSENALDTVERDGDNDCLVAQQGREMTVIGTGPVDGSNPNLAFPLEDANVDLPFFDGGEEWFVGDDWYDSPPEEIKDPQPPYQGDEPSVMSPEKVCDVNQLILDLKAPSNAIGFSFDFIFASSEYEEWIDQGFNDTFYAIIEHEGLNGGERTNIAFDSNNNEIEVDVNFFENDSFPCDENGSVWSPNISGVSGTTGWLRTTRSLGEKNAAFRLTFSIHDEGDCIFDSAVFLDNFQWITEGVEITDETVPIVVI